MITSLMGSDGWKDNAPRWNHEIAPLVTCPIENRMTSIRQEPIKSATEIHDCLRNLKSTKLKAKKTPTDTTIHMNCFKKKLPSPVKEFIVTRPAPRSGSVARKSIQSIPFSSFSFLIV